MSKAREMERKATTTPREALESLAQATPKDAALALRLWQDRCKRADAELLEMAAGYEREKLVPEGTALAFAAAVIPREPSSQVELYARVLEFYDALWTRGQADSPAQGGEP